MMKVGSCGSGKNEAAIAHSEMCSFMNLYHFIEFSAEVCTPLLWNDDSIQDISCQLDIMDVPSLSQWSKYVY